MKLLPVFALKMGGVALPKMISSQCVLCQGFRSSAASEEPGLPTTYCFIAGGRGGVGRYTQGLCGFFCHRTALSKPDRPRIYGHPSALAPSSARFQILATIPAPVVYTCL